MDNKKKRILALLGVALLLAVFLLPMAAAFGTGEQARSRFIASLGVVIFVPVFLYICMMAAKVWGNKKSSAQGRIRNVIFDVGNVLVDFDWKGYLAGFGFDSQKYETLANALFRNELWNERDRSDKEEAWYVDRFVEQCPQYEAEVRELMRRSPEGIRQMDYAETWVRYLKGQGLNLYILSNYSHYMLDRNRPDMKFLPYMDGEVFSCDVGLIKPEKEIYQVLLDRYGLVPEECVFLDDKQENCRVAESLGIKTIVFREFKQAAGELDQLISAGKR